MGYGSWDADSYRTYAYSTGRSVTSTGDLSGTYTHQDLFVSKKIDPKLQCYSVDAPRAKKRVNPTGASKPVDAIQVGYFDPNDHRYHAVFGEIFDRKTKTWDWLEVDPQNLLDWLLA